MTLITRLPIRIRNHKIREQEIGMELQNPDEKIVWISCLRFFAFSKEDFLPESVVRILTFWILKRSH